MKALKLTRDCRGRGGASLAPRRRWPAGLPDLQQVTARTVGRQAWRRRGLRMSEPLEGEPVVIFSSTQELGLRVKPQRGCVQGQL